MQEENKSILGNLGTIETKVTLEFSYDTYYFAFFIFILFVIVPFYLKK